MNEALTLIERILNGIIAVCLLSATMFGGVFAVYLLTQSGVVCSIAFGALFATAFTLGVMKRD